MHRRRFLRYLQILYLRQRLTPHAPVAFALRAVACMFALLFVMPLEPLSMPTAFGGGLAFAILTH